MSRIIELTREENEIPVERTDGSGILNGKFQCKELHKFLARPIAGPYLDSEPKPCTRQMTFNVVNKNYPIKPVLIIVPASAGTVSDVTARYLAQKLSERWEQPVIVDNKPGASGSIAASATARAMPDGYTLLLGTSSIFSAQAFVYPKLAFDPIQDFAPVTMVASSQDVLVVRRSLPARSIKELVQLTRDKPGQISFASPGIGTTSHLAGEMFKLMAGIDIAHRPYKGTGLAIADLSAERGDMSFSGVQPLLPSIKSGDLRALAVTGNRRSPLLPDVPTVAEAGIPGYEAKTWSGVFAPAKTPTDVIQKINVDIAGILKSPEMKKHLLSLGAEPVGNTPGQFATVIEADISRWAKVVKAAGVRAE